MHVITVDDVVLASAVANDIFMLRILRIEDDVVARCLFVVDKSNELTLFRPG